MMSALERPNLYRCIAMSIFLIGYWNKETVQLSIDNFWVFLRNSWIFNSVYFETWFATFCYTFLLYIPFKMCQFDYFDRFKIDSRVTFDPPGMAKILFEMVVYCSPLMTLDTFMVKQYPGVSPQVLNDKRKHWIQSVRALPEESISVEMLLLQLIGSLILYDLFFFFLHYTLHKNRWLYKNIHADHHDHGVIQSRITNQLSVTERIALVLTANFSLRCFRSHPLTRMIFVPVFIWLLIENHSGLDLPFSYDKFVPFGLSGGPRSHFEHHTLGKKHYQPFLNYLDRIVSKFESSELNEKSKL